MAIGELERIVTRLIADTRDWSRGLSVAQSQLSGFQKTTATSLGSMSSLLTRFAGTAAAAFSVHAMVDFTKRALETADAIGDLSAAAGLSAERFQRLQYAMSFSGVSAEEFASAMTTLSRVTGGALAGQERAKKGFEALGIATEGASFAALTQGEVFDTVMEKLATYGSHAERTAAAAKLLGDAVGARFVVAAEQGIAAFRDLQAQGLVLSDSQVRVAAQANDAWDRVTTQIGVGLRGAIIDAIAATGQFVSAFSLEQISNEIARIEGQIDDLTAKGLTRGKLTLSTETRGARVAELQARIKELEEEGARRRREQHQSSPEFRAQQAAEARAAREKERTEEDAKRESERREQEIARGREQAKRDSYKAEYDALLEQYKREDELREARAQEEKRLREQKLEGEKKLADAIADYNEKKYHEQAEAEARIREQRAEAEKEYEDAIAKHREEQYHEQQRELEDLQQALADRVTEFATNSERAWEQMKTRIIRAIAEIAIKWATSKIGQPATAGGGSFDLGAILGSASSGASMSFGGGFASGGSPIVGRAALVGEHGPELFVPRTAGTIVPGGRFGVGPGGGGTTHVELGVEVSIEPGMTATQERRRGIDGRERVLVAVRTAAQDDISRGGPLSRTIAADTGQRRAPRRGVS